MFCLLGFHAVSVPGIQLGIAGNLLLGDDPLGQRIFQRNRPSIGLPSRLGNALIDGHFGEGILGIFFQQRLLEAQPGFLRGLYHAKAQLLLRGQVLRSLSCLRLHSRLLLHRRSVPAAADQGAGQQNPTCHGNSFSNGMTVLFHGYNLLSCRF